MLQSSLAGKLISTENNKNKTFLCVENHGFVSKTFFSEKQQGQEKF